MSERRALREVHALRVPRAPILTAFAAVNLGLFALYVLIFGQLVLTGAWRGADFTPFYTGFRIVLEGHGAALYDPAVQAAAQRSVLEGQSYVGGLVPFNNPPHVVLPFVPLGLLPLPAAFAVWMVAQVALLIVFARLLLGESGGWSGTERLALIGWLLGFPALGIAFFQGAFSLLVTMAILAAYASLRRGADRSAGAWLVLASIKPQALAGPALSVLVGRRWRAVGVAIAGAIGLALIATAAFGIGIWPQYLSFLGRFTATFDQLGVDPSVMWNLRGTLTLILGSEQAALINVIGYVGFALGLIAIAVLWREGWSPRADPRDHALRFALTIAITLLLSPHLNPQDDLLLVVAAALGYGALRGERLGALLAVGASLSPIVILLDNGLSVEAPTSLPIRIPTLVGIALAGLLLVALRTPRVDRAVAA